MDQNLRMCGDCHTAIALVSKIENCKITIRDSRGFMYLRMASVHAKGIINKSFVK